MKTLPMKILIVSDAWKPQVNGVVRTYEFLCAELEKQGIATQVIGPCDFPWRMKMPGYSEIELALAASGRLRKLIRAYNPTSLHIATEGPLGWAARKYCLKNGIPFTTAYHTQFPDYVSKRVAKLLPPLADWSRDITLNVMKGFHAPSSALMVATRSVEDELKAAGYTAPLHMFSRGVHVELFTPGEPDLFHDLKRPVALYVGRVAIEKNLEDFLSMDWDGSKVVVGEGPSKAELMKKYPDVHFAGKKEGTELASHYRSADVFVFPSRTDTFGMVLVEALASGLPVAAYNVTGPRDIVTEPHLGVLHDNLSHAAKTALLHDSTAAERHAHVRKNYSWEEVARQFIAIQKQAEEKT